MQKKSKRYIYEQVSKSNLDVFNSKIGGLEKKTFSEKFSGLKSVEDLKAHSSMTMTKAQVSMDDNPYKNSVQPATNSIDIQEILAKKVREFSSGERKIDPRFNRYATTEAPHFNIKRVSNSLERKSPVYESRQQNVALKKNFSAKLFNPVNEIRGINRATDQENQEIRMGTYLTEVDNHFEKPKRSSCCPTTTTRK